MKSWRWSMTGKKIAFIIAPCQEVERPPCAPAVLYSTTKQDGHDLIIMDLNLWLYKSLDGESWRTLDYYWKTSHINLEGETDKVAPIIDKWFKRYIKLILAKNPDLIGISVFSKWSIRSTIMLLNIFKEMKIDIPIIVGGSGITTPFRVKTSQSAETELDSNFAEYLLSNNLISAYIIGEAEISLNEYLKGNLIFPGINNNNPSQVTDLDSIPFADYSQTPPSNYFPTTDYGVYITASRGCIRKCKFCDVPYRWPKYYYKDGKLVAEEIFSYYEQYGVNIIQFTDNLINGNIREYNKMNERLIELKEEHPGFKPDYMGFFICRHKNQMDAEIYKKMGDAGAKTLVVGIEHASEKVRTHMDKNFTNDDIDHHFEQCARNGIKNFVLMFIGYPTETLEDHQMNIDFLYKYKKYMQSGTISLLRLGLTGSMDIGSPMASNNTDLTLVPQKPNLDLSHLMDHDQDWIYGRNWINVDNPDLTLEERIRRRMELHKISVNLSYNQPKIKEELYTLKKILWEFQERNTNKEKSHIPLFTESADAHD